MLPGGREESLSLCAATGKPGHWACSCLEGRNVCYLLADKQDMLIIELMAAKDVTDGLSLEVMNRMLDNVPEDF